MKNSPITRTGFLASFSENLLLLKRLKVFKLQKKTWRTGWQQGTWFTRNANPWSDCRPLRVPFLQLRLVLQTFKHQIRSLPPRRPGMVWKRLKTGIRAGLNEPFLLCF